MLATPLIVLTLSSDPNWAESVFTDCEKTLKAAKSVSGVLVGQGGKAKPYHAAFLLQKPKSFRVVDGTINIYCNGKTQFNHLVAEKQFFKRDVSETLGSGTPYSLDSFFGHPTGSLAPYFTLRTEFRKQKIGGIECAAKAIYFESFGRDDRMVFFVNGSTKQVIGWDQVFGGTKMHFRLEDLRFNVQVPKGAFDWTPLPGLKEKLIDQSSRHR